MANHHLGFVCPGHPKLGREVFTQAGIPLGRISFNRFSDSESHVVVDSDVHHKVVFVFQVGVRPANESLMELIQACDAIKHAGAKRLVVVMPFVPYRRQEKQVRSGESLTLRLVGELLQTAGVDELITVNLHRPQTVKWLARQTFHLSVLHELIAAVSKKHPIDVVCAPDNGAIPLAQEAARELGAEIVSVTKHRTGPDQVIFKHMNGGTQTQIKGKRILILDDEINTGATIAGVARLLKLAKAKSMTVAAVHGVLSTQALRSLKPVPYDRVFLTNTLPITPRALPRLQVVSISHVLADAVARRAQWL